MLDMLDIKQYSYDMDKYEIAQRLREARKARSITQTDLAKRMGVTRQTIIRWEENAGLLNCNYLAMICEILEVSADYLLFGTDTTKSTIKSVFETLEKLNENEEYRSISAESKIELVAMILSHKL